MEKFRNKEEAARAWVSGFNAFPTDMLVLLMDLDTEDEWSEETAPAYGNRVYVFAPPQDCITHEGEIIKVSNGLYTVLMDDGIKLALESDEFEVSDRYDFFPIWGTIWQFDDSVDEWWLTDNDGIKAMSECGFRIYHSEKWGYFFGIDGAGYDFYESHWIPLYEKRGLMWHQEN